MLIKNKKSWVRNEYSSQKLVVWTEDSHGHFIFFFMLFFPVSRTGKLRAMLTDFYWFEVLFCWQEHITSVSPFSMSLPSTWLMCFGNRLESSFSADLVVCSPSCNPNISWLTLRSLLIYSFVSTAKLHRSLYKNVFSPDCVFASEE